MALHTPRRLAAIGLAAGTAAAQPNLVPLLSSPMGAGVGVQNTGDSAAGPSHLTINCTKLGKADGESNEADNALQTSYTELPSVAIAPQQPLAAGARPAPSRPVQPKLSSTAIFQQKQERPQHQPRRLPAK